MSFTREQQQNAYKKLSVETQYFITSNETAELIETSLSNISLSEEQMNLTDSEILWAMLGLQTLSDAVVNIAKISRKSENDLIDLKNKLQSNIFDKIQENQSTTDENDVVTEKSETDVKKTFKKERVSEEEISNLPQNKQKFILDGVWQERTDEVAKKYSLSDTQTENLVGNVLLVLTDREKPEDFLETIISELGISRLLAEQILEDLEVRVFEYAVKSMERKGEVESRKQSPVLSSALVPGSIKSESDAEKKEVKQAQPETLPEIRPDILPEVEPNILPAVERPSAEIEVVPTAPFPKPVQQAVEEVLVKPEPVQKSISVPRFTAEPTPQTPTSVPQSSAPEKKYAVDPYREPIE